MLQQPAMQARKTWPAAEGSQRSGDKKKPILSLTQEFKSASLSLIRVIDESNPSMTIQPLPSRPREISVTEAVEPAYERVKLILFRPFDFSKWIIVGFCAWLAGLGDFAGRGGTGGFNPGSYHDHGTGEQPLEHFRNIYHRASDYFVLNMDWMIPVFILLTVVVLALWVGLVWLSCRGSFMWVHCVTGNLAEVERPWREFAGEARSLFWFRIGIGLAGMVVMLPMLVFLIANIVRMVMQGEADFAGMMLVAGLGLGLLLLSIFFAVIRKFTVDFVVPLMFLRRGTCVAAWRELKGLLVAHPGEFALYILFQIVLKVAIGMITVVAIIATCCLALCLLAVPFIGTVLLLPVLVFQRAYPLYYLAQYGPQYDVFAAAPSGQAI